MHFESIIFDLDGTLVNSLSGIEASARYAVEKCLPERKLPALRELIGPPIATMLAMLWPDLDQDRLKAVVTAFREHYDVQGCLLSELYPNVAETLDHLRHCGLRLFVLTNKPLYHFLPRSLRPTLLILWPNRRLTGPCCWARDSGWNPGTPGLWRWSI